MEITGFFFLNEQLSVLCVGFHLVAWSLAESSQATLQNYKLLIPQALSFIIAEHSFIMINYP